MVEKMKIRINAVNNFYEYHHFSHISIGALFIKSINDGDIYLKVSIYKAYNITKKRLCEFDEKDDILFISNLTDNDLIL